LDELKANSTLDKQGKVRGADCGVDAASAVQNMSRAGMQIAQAVKACAGKNTSDILKASAWTGHCAADIEGAVASMLWVATWISMAASHCSDAAKLDTMCAGMIEGLVSAAADIASSGTAMMDACSEKTAKEGMDMDFTERRLENEEPPEDEADLELAMCIQDSTLAATALAQFGVASDQSIFVCPGLADHDNTSTVNEVCAHDVSYMLNRMFQTFAFLGASLTHCGRWLGKHNPGECLSAASQLTASAAGIPMSGTGMDLTCKGTMHYLGETFGEHGVDLASVAAIARRRLDGGASADGPVLV